MEEDLNTKEWLDKETEGYFQLYSDCKHEDANYDDFISIIEKYLERYANYKNRILEDRIKEFGKLLKNEQAHTANENLTISNKMYNLLSIYLDTFNIK